MKRGAFLSIGLMFSMFTLLSSSVWAVPLSIQYQGKLTNASGRPVTDPTLTMTFRIYDVETEGVPLWTETQNSVTVERGVFSVVLGIVTPITLPFDTPYYLGVEIETDGEMTPRLALTSVPYAFRAGDADYAYDVANDSVTTSKIAYGSVTNIKIANDAVTDIKISGQISSSKIQTAGLDADTVDTMHASDLLDKATYDSDSDSIVDSCQIAAEVNIPLALSGSVSSGGIISGTNSNSDGYGVYGEGYGADGYGVYGTGNSTYGYIGAYLYGVFGEHIYGDTYGYLGGSSYGAYGQHVEDEGPDPDLLNYGYLGSTYHGVYGRVESGESGDTAVQGYFSANQNMGYLGGYFYGVYGVHPGSGNWGYIGGNAYAGYFQGNVQVSGRTSTGSLRVLGGADIAEPFEIRSTHELRPGMVVAIDTENAGHLTIAEKAYDRRVAGIISGAGGVNTGVLMGQEGSVADGANPVALSGRVYCWGDASTGPIKPGDLLTTSMTPGHAMKVTDYSRAQGAILGKAMSSLEKGTGLVLVLVTLQ